MKDSSAALLALGFCLCASVAAADDCPTAQSARKGFIVERGPQSKTEVVYTDARELRTIYRYNDRTLLEVTLFDGLFELERLDRGKRSIYRPVSDLSKGLPLTPGKKITAIFEQTEGDRKGSLRTVILEVRKDPDTLSIGACKYAVLRIDRSQMDDKSRPVFIETDYYALDLKLIIAKEYRERDGGTTLNKYDRIYLTSR